MTLGRNLLAGLANSVWTAIVTLAVVPLYLKYLGIEAYGLIGFFATTQALLQILDLGLAPTINREVARCSATENLGEAGNLLHTLAVIYWAMAGFIALLTVAIAPSIATYWLRSDHLPQETIAHAVMLMGLVVACRWPIGLYQGALMGAQRLTVSSFVNIAMVTLGNFGAVGVLAFVSPTIQAFFIWQASVGLACAAMMRWAAWRAVGRVGLRFSVDQLRHVWRFSLGLSGITLSALVFTQLDKVILSKTLGLEEFGRYTLATVVASVLYILITPMFNVTYPRFSALIASGNTEKLSDMYRVGTRLSAAALFPIAMSLAVFAEDFLRVWTGNPDIARNVAPLVGLLSIGSALHGVMHFPYALQLAYGRTGLPLVINGILMVIMAPLILVLALSYGALGGAAAWLLLHILYLVIGSWLTHRHLLKMIGAKWLFQDVGIPFGLSLLVGILGSHLILGAGLPLYANLLYGTALPLVAFLLILAVSPELRFVLFERLGWNKAVARRDLEEL